MSKFSERLKLRRNEKKLTQQTLADLVGVNRVTYTNWENGKREPELGKVVELATELNTTVDYLLGNSDINLLDTSKEDIQNLTKEEAKELSGSLMENMNTIFEAGKEKFNMTEDEMEAMKVLVIKQFLKKAEENEKNDSSNP
ncbi:helix-turn-helix domain-containing protein [Carnobacterium divergens]|uniref:Helix-turn-helix domain-containing protein n=1 Tax=Carnobacterium divergens TaxID=2748 RepID=A0AAW8R8I4_CARDV|nr:helix-turn-helix transcriptional regulator [Carnobacterium divergens]MDT1957744.1 helix-turn-helix domain-containing protein [Carnobacterium divergens]MDT1973372.1 helix-turn-helix domain-containing protein [Carnobacterium divergens]